MSRRAHEEINSNVSPQTPQPPRLNISVPKLSDIQPDSKPWESVKLPTDILLLTVKDPEFLSCYAHLKQGSIFKSHVIGLGLVYFGEIGNNETVKVCLLRCGHNGAATVDGALNVVRSAVEFLTPKAVICVGFCDGLNQKEAKLGDVVISARLATYCNKKVTKNGVQSCNIKTDVSRNMNALIRSAADGWKAPITTSKDQELFEVKVHCDGVILSGPEQVNSEVRQNELLEQYSDAIAIEMQGEGLYSAAFNLQIEWLVVKGISGYADGTNSDTECWQHFASVMAASVVHNILKEPAVLKGWSHYREKIARQIPVHNNSIDGPSQAEDVKTAPPKLTITLPRLEDIDVPTKRWNSIQLPTDVLLLTVKDIEFLSCLYYLKKESVFKSTCAHLGRVYFGCIGDSEEKVKVSLMICDKGAVAAHGALSVATRAISSLKPKAVICVGVCGGLNKKKAKLGDVVISAKLCSYSNRKVRKDGEEQFEEPCGVKVNVSMKMGNLIKVAAHGWKAPLENPEELQVKVHRGGVMLSGPELVDSGDRRRQLLKQCPDAIGIEMEGEGVYAAAYGLEIEWLVVKGISDYADGTKKPTENWQPFASVMAASVVHNILKDPGVLSDWLNYKGTGNTTLHHHTVEASSPQDTRHLGNSLEQLL